MKCIALIFNPSFGEKALKVARELLAYLEARGKEVLLLADQACFLGRSGVGQPEIKKAELLLSLGGDGTLLSTVSLAGPLGLPVLGINLGRLGFLTELDVANMYAGLEAVLAGKFAVEERALLEGRVIREGKVVKQVLCLNECVVGRGALSRPCRLEVRVDGQCAFRFTGDGIIIATPTGSTAYSFSAGGPIIDPQVAALVLTPICPHAFVLRPFVVPDSSLIEVLLLTSVTGMCLTADGHEGIPLLAEDRVVVKRYARSFKLVRLFHRSFYCLVRDKLISQGLEECLP
ncbi:NAD(+)/NADH kinase [Ammonifex thiophilus]|uniref:NAD kinase n=1 Tax=Ammonifex thiophilus TaxID=444093 RepID=A0A3D8P6L1_9THEO|nr:NAD(+)/NADH kinase [Ammonifex thiophilus]RDV83994.1 NAD(+)/NADH kinase [Ammonifex thiophilus]